MKNAFYCHIHITSIHPSFHFSLLSNYALFLRHQVCFDFQFKVDGLEETEKQHERYEMLIL